MKKYYIFVLFLIATLVMFNGCDSSDDNTNDPQNPSNFKVTVTGKVVDDSTNTPIGSAIVSFLKGNEQLNQLTTDENGAYTTTFNISDSIISDLKVAATKTGYTPAETEIDVVTGKTYTVADLKLKKTGSVNVKSGNPASIYLVTQTLPSIGVKENGILLQTVLQLILAIQLQ